YLTVDKESALNRTKLQVQALLRERRHIQPGQDDDFAVQDTREIANALGSVTGVLTALLGAVAGVSLLVGGIGIMNIMLVSVTERTREIGTRLAIGALASEVLLQFLVEAVLLCVLGGAIGIGFGLLGSWAASRALSMPFAVDYTIVLIAFVFSGFIGILFGYVPARRAARLNPIEALRHE
ncbi:MAG TPA: FtsX-like permease family protein, partial [Polyangiaceae bacterium]